jgi:hypothetical protein
METSLEVTFQIEMPDPPRFFPAYVVARLRTSPRPTSSSPMVLARGTCKACAHSHALIVPCLFVFLNVRICPPSFWNQRVRLASLPGHFETK